MDDNYGLLSSRGPGTIHRIMIRDEYVLRILERPDIDASDKILLIYILSRESEPTEKTDELTGVKVTTPGVARIPREQFSNALGRGFTDEVALRKRTTKLKNKGWLSIKQSKGNQPNRYRVTFPQKKKQIPASVEPS